MRKIGAHVSAAGGIDKAVERAKEIGANCVQVFSGSPRVWARPGLDKTDQQKVFSKQKELSVTPIITHAIYLTNLASDNPELLKKSIEVLKYDLRFDSYVKGSGVVVHLGSHQGRGWEPMREQVAAAIAEVLADTPADSQLLIENSAGQNGKLCSDLSEIRWLLDTVKSERLGWCFDTCHAHAAGLALGKPGTQPSECRSAIEAIEAQNLWSALKVIHVNDSRDAFGSGRDRHANLGDGEVNKEDFTFFLNYDAIKDIPLILEVPGLDDEGPDAENVKRLRTLVGEA
ncbi:MAG TPA: deoxyribonuclease IV [Vitreimonas sp.]|nr:deoxyribonuclease IV [Vitreimonas sp.]